MTKRMGPRSRTDPRSKTIQLQGLPTFIGRASATGRLYHGKPRIWTDPPLQIPYGLTLLLHQEEGWDP